MAKWELIKKILDESNGKSKDEIGCWFDAYIHEDEDGDNILIIYGNGDMVEYIEKELSKDPELIAEAKEHFGDREPYSEWFIDKATDNSWSYSDNGFLCDECNKWHYYDDSGAVSYRNYYVGDGWIICENCIKENEEYTNLVLEQYINNPKSVNTIFTHSELIDMDFYECGDIYRNGWYGIEDNPTKIMEKAIEDEPDYDYLFCIERNYNPFEIEFTLWRREREV